MLQPAEVSKKRPVTSHEASFVAICYKICSKLPDAQSFAAVLKYREQRLTDAPNAEDVDICRQWVISNIRERHSGCMSLLRVMVEFFDLFAGYVLWS
jgi:hypothetical protein